MPGAAHEMMVKVLKEHPEWFDLLLRTLPGYVRGDIRPQPQPETGATYARKITRDDGRLDWSRPAVEVEGCWVGRALPQ